MSDRKKQPALTKPPSPTRRWARTSGPVGAAQAKAHLLAIMDDVMEKGMPVIVTRRGVPQVQIAPLDPEMPAPDIIGCMKGTFQVTGDIVGPEPDKWEAMQ